MLFWLLSIVRRQRTSPGWHNWPSARSNMTAAKEQSVTLPAQAQVVICGGGIMGTSVAYHLSKMGWKDIILLEQGRLAAGSTRFCAGIVSTARHLTIEQKMADYSNKLYHQLEQETGIQTGYIRTGSISLAQTQDRLISLKRINSRLNVIGIPSEIISPKKVAELHPLLNVHDLVGAMHVPEDAVVSSADVALALASAASQNGVQIYDRTTILHVMVKKGQVTGVETDKGQIECQYFVNCAGQWAYELGLSNEEPVSIPLHACEHFYLLTRPLETPLQSNTPTIVDADGRIYIRNWQGGILSGGFEKNPKPIFTEGKNQLEIQNLQEDWDHFEPLLSSLLRRMPELETLEIMKLVNCPETFTPDMRCIMGESPVVQGYFVLAGMNSAGLSFGGGAGKYLAEWMVDGYPSENVWELDLKRFGALQSSRTFLRHRVMEVMRDGTRMADSTTMLSISDPIHMVLIKTDIFGETTLIASYFLEWRSVLGSENGVTSLTVELMGVGTESKVSVGILNMKLEMYPALNQTLSQEVVNTQLALERQKTAEKERLFLVYAKQWWREYLQIRPSHNSRLVKIFAQDENGINRPVCSYVKPLRAGRLLDTPRQAARFVNVLGYERAPVIGGGGKQEQWCTLLAFLCRNKGDCEDHANLLCSLLLGYGLEAFVCVGTKAKGVPHAWVMTCGTDGTITFWESLTGHRYIHKPTNPDEPPPAEQPKPLYPYRTIGCVFNHQMFLGNCQPSDAVETCVFDLNDESKWKPMSEEAIKSVCAPGATTSLPPFPPLCASTIDASVTSNEIEMQLRLLVSEHRKDLGLTTVWEDQLSYLLSPALASYEFERTTSISAGNEEFQDAIRRAVPDGHTFKGFPIHFVYRNARRAFATCLRSPFCEEIICCRGDQVRLAVRVRVFTYPESACAVWIMFACKYRSVL